MGTPVPASFQGGLPEIAFRRGYRPAAIADQDGVTFFNTKKRNKKQAQVMIDPPQSGLRQATGWANSWSLVQSNSLGLDSTDQEAHFSPAPQRFELIYSTFFRGLLRLETGNSGHKAEPVLTIVLYDLQSIRNLSRVHPETPDENSTPREVSVRKGGIFHPGKKIKGLHGGVHRYRLAGGWAGCRDPARTTRLAERRDLGWRSHRPWAEKDHFRMETISGR